MNKGYNPIYSRYFIRSRVLLLVLATVLFAADAWAQVSGYSFRIRLEVDNAQVSGSSSFTDFPILVDFTDPDLRSVGNGGNVENSNGYDIVFTASDGSTLLNHQLESYDASTGRVVAWVQIPTLQATANTPFYLYYGNSSVGSDPSTAATWDANYQMIHHYETGLTDATAAGNDGTNNGTDATAGIIGNGRLFDATDFISVADDPSLDITGQITMSLWINPANSSTGPDLITKGIWSDAYSSWIRTNQRLAFGTNGVRLNSNGSVTDNTWFYLVFTKDASGRNIYINGTLDNNDSNTNNFDVNSNPLEISSSAYPYHGVMDEIRISNTARPADWVATEYNNQNNPGGFIIEVPEPPVLANIESSAQTFNAGEAPVTITDSITVSDPFYSQLQGATVQITNNFIAAEDVLDFSNTANITGAWDVATGTLTLSGAAPLSEYQTALRNVTYENTDTTSPDQSTRTIAFIADNGPYQSNTVTRDLNIDAPTAQFRFLVEQAPSGNITSKTAGQVFDIKITALDSLDNVVTSFEGTANITSTGSMGTGMGTTANFTNGVLSAHSVSIISTGDVTITATNSDGPETGDSNLFTVSPGPASETTSTISASPQTILNDGSSTSTITVQLKDQYGNNLTAGGDNVVLNTDNGSLGPVTDNGDGTYTATLTSSTSEVTATITGTVNGNTIDDDAQVQFVAFTAIWESSGSNPTDWNHNQNWSSNSVPTSGDVILIPSTPADGTGFPIVDVNGQTVGEVNIESGADITVSGGINFIITGDLSGAGEVNGAGDDTLSVGGDLSLSSLPIGTVYLNGTSRQIVTNPHTYTDLTVDNTAGVDVSDNLYVNGTLTLASGTLKIPSGKNLIANSKSIGSGQLAFERIVNGSKGWRMIGSPVASTYEDLLDSTVTQGYPNAFYSTGSLPGDTLQPNVLWYDETYSGTDNQRWRAPANATDTITAGRGQFVYFFGDVTGDGLYNNPLPDTLLVNGQEHEGDGTEFDFNVTYTTTADSGWNFVANPYGATLDWDAAGWTKLNVDNTIYVWDPEANGGNGEYLTWNGSTGTLGSGLIAPFQGFWVKANGSAPVLSVNKSNKTTGGNFKRKEAEVQGSTIPVAMIKIGYESLSATTSLSFQNGANSGKDVNDGHRLLPFTDTFLEIFTTLNNGTQMAVNNLPEEFDQRLLVPLHVGGFIEQEPISGTVTMTWPGLRNIPNEWVLTLVDHKTGNEIDMLARDNYMFEMEAGNKSRYKTNHSGDNFRLQETSDEKGRFTIRISTHEIEAQIPNQAYLRQNYPNPFNPTTTIVFGLSEDTDVTLNVYNILGRRVKTLISNRLGAGIYDVNFDARGLASGVYIYRLTAGDRSYVKKFTFIK